MKASADNLSLSPRRPLSPLPGLSPRPQLSPTNSKTNILSPRPGLLSPSRSKRNMISPRPSLSPITPTSTKKKAAFSAEYRNLRKSFEDNYKQYRTKRNPHDAKSLAVGYQYWNNWVKKHNKTLTVRLTKREFQSFWGWFSSRVEEHSSDKGIEINRIVDDFLQYKICQSRAEGADMLRRIDTDGNGSISFDEFISGMSESTDVSQVLALKKFVTFLDVEGNFKSKYCTPPSSTAAEAVMVSERRAKRRSTLEGLPKLKREVSMMDMNGMDVLPIDEEITILRPLGSTKEEEAKNALEAPDSGSMENPKEYVGVASSTGSCEASLDDGNTEEEADSVVPNISAAISGDSKEKATSKVIEDSPNLQSLAIKGGEQTCATGQV